MGLTEHYDPPVAFGSRQGALIALQIFFIVVALIVYGLRLYTRAHILHSTASDDYLMGVAMLFSIALTVNACVSTRFGWGKHLYEVSFSEFHSLLFCIWFAELLFTLTTTLVKISVLLFYLRIAVTTTYRRVIYGSIALITAWGVAFTAVIVFQCHPVSEYWNPLSEHCASPEAALFVHGLTNTITDIYVYVLPMQMVWKTQLPKRQRIGLLIIFGAGFLVCVAGALRLFYTIQNEKSNDATWQGFNLWTWESIEVNLGIVCASAPCLKALASRVLPKLMGSSNASSMSRTPTGHYQMNARRDGGRPHYVLESIGEVRRDNKTARESGESQEVLTKSKEFTLIAKVDSDRMV